MSLPVFYWVLLGFPLLYVGLLRFKTFLCGAVVFCSVLCGTVGFYSALCGAVGFYSVFLLSCSVLQCSHVELWALTVFICGVLLCFTWFYVELFGVTEFLVLLVVLYRVLGVAGVSCQLFFLAVRLNTLVC